MSRIMFYAIALSCFLVLLRDTYGCNEAVCASVVSKCMLTQSCKCDLKDCSCCKECFACLSYLYNECCSCVDMCPKPNETNHNELSKKSYVEEFPDGVPGLFQALTNEPDAENRWVSLTYPIDLDISHYLPANEKETKYHLQTVDQDLDIRSHNTITLNCTVAFMSQCMSCDKCRHSCQSMGSSSIRWFHDGCCECIGDKCINYGINQSKCLTCPDGKDSVGPESEDEYLLTNDEDNLDYSEDMEQKI